MLLGATGADGAAGVERLNAELNGGEATGGDMTLGCGAGAEGIDKSRRSFMPEVEAAGFAGAGDVNALKLPRPADGLVVLFWDCA